MGCHTCADHHNHNHNAVGCMHGPDFVAPPFSTCPPNPCDQPVLFHTVVVPANLGDDTTYPPTSLNYRNVILLYEANDSVYIYSSDGIPVLVTSGELKTLVAQLSEQVEKLQEAVDNADLEEFTEKLIEFQDRVNDANNTANEAKQAVEVEASEREAAINDLTETLTNETTNREAAITAVNEKVSTIEATTVQTDTTVSGDDSTVTITKSTAMLRDATSPTETGMPLPVANETQAGVVNPATYKQIQDMAEKIDVILAGSVADPTLPSDPSDEQLTDAWKKATGKDELLNGAKITGPDGKTYIYYENTGTWQEYSEGGGSIEVMQFTNEASGIIKGDATTEGKVFAEADGTGSVNGWDTLKAQVGTNTSEIDSLEARVYTAEDTLDKLDETFATKTELSQAIETANIPEVVQTTGDSVSAVMSQKAVTDLVGDVEDVLRDINTGAGV